MGLLDDQTPQEYYDGGNYGNYQFVSLSDIITQFEIAYVGEDRLISKIKRADIAFFAQRAIQELSFDTFRSIKSQEIEVPATLQMTLPQDYVNYTKITFVDNNGIKCNLYPTSKTSNPPSPFQNDDGDFSLNAIGTLDADSSNIVLTDEHTNIIVGMVVIGQYIPSNTFVGATSNSSSITTITLHDSDGNTVEPDESLTNATLTFTNSDGSLVLKQKSSHVVENLTYNVTDTPKNKITASAAADIEEIKVGMLVSHDDFPGKSDDFPFGTVVTHVDGTTIIVSNDNTLATTAGSVTTGEITFIEIEKDSTTWSNYKNATANQIFTNNHNLDFYSDKYLYYDLNYNRRYGIDPQYAQSNGSFYIDQEKIYFSSNISGKTVILDYISDGLGTDDDEEIKVHKFAEEAMYKYIACAILSARANIPEYIVQRFKKEKFAAVRTAKLRLSNLKIEELTQILRGKSKQIKH